MVFRKPFIFANIRPRLFSHHFPKLALRPRSYCDLGLGIGWPDTPAGIRGVYVVDGHETI
jgi:hypothetical protein